MLSFTASSMVSRSVCRKWKEMKEEAVTWNYLWSNLFSPSESVYTYLFRNYCACSSHLYLVPGMLEPDWFLQTNNRDMRYLKVIMTLSRQVLTHEVISCPFKVKEIPYLFKVNQVVRCLWHLEHYDFLLPAFRLAFQTEAAMQHFLWRPAN